MTSKLYPSLEIITQSYFKIKNYIHKTPILTN